MAINLLIHPVTSVEWSAENLPKGLNINPSTGVISGTPLEDGTFETIITCKNNWGATSTKKQFIINKPLYPELFGENNYEGYTTESISFKLNTVNCNINSGVTSVKWVAQNLPDGISINENNGIISGTFTTANVYNVTVTVTNNFGSDSFSFKYKINDVTLLYPEFLEGNFDKDCYLNTPIESFKINCKNSKIENKITSVKWSAHNLPDGISINSSTGQISGTPNLNSYKIYNGHTYKLFETPMSWYNAKEYCESIGGHLVVILNGDTQNFLQNNFNFAQRIWLGAYFTSDGRWKWITTDEFPYANWYSGEPNANWDNAIDIWGDAHPGYWADDHVNDQFKFICEWDNDDLNLSKYDTLGYSNKLLITYNSTITCTNNYSSDSTQYNHKLYLFRPPYFTSSCNFNYYANENETSPISSSSDKKLFRLGPANNIKNNIFRGTFYIPLLYKGGMFKLINTNFKVKYKFNNSYQDWYSCIASIDNVDENANNFFINISCKFEKFGEISFNVNNENNSNTLQWPITIRYEINDEHIDYNLYLTCVSEFDNELIRMEYYGEESKLSKVN